MNARRLLAAAACVLGLGTAMDAAAQSCTVGGGTAPSIQRDLVQRRLSANAEAVAPTPGRRRSAAPPSRVVVTMPVVNYIDQRILDRLIEKGVPPTAVSSDAEFLRRVTLDLTGRIPDSASVQAFVADTAPDKRTRRIDALIASDAFNDRWTMWFGDLVQNVIVSNNIVEYYQGRNAYYSWIRESFRAAKPYDAMVRELVTGAGDSFVVGNANYVVRQRQPNGPPQDTYDNLATHSAEKFLGMPMLCVSCHGGKRHLEEVNGYLTGKTREDFWKMAAFFSRTTLRPEPGDPANPNVRKYQVGEDLNGRYRLNTQDGNKTPRVATVGESAVVAPAFILNGEAPMAGESYRTAYGRILTARPEFARNTVNLLWKEMFGLALVEPVNAMDLSKRDSQPSHPQLLDALTSDFIASGYSTRSLLKTIASSSAYQLSARYTPGPWSEAWVPLYARHYPRRLMAEMVLDAVIQATSVPIQLNVQGVGVIDRAMLLPDTLEGARGQSGTFLNEFGRGDRDDNPRTSDAAIAQALEMMNDTLVTSRVKRTTLNSTVAKIVAATSDPGVATEQLYLATLSRYPTAEEKQVAAAYLRSGTYAQKLEDLQFVLLNSLEFLFN